MQRRSSIAAALATALVVGSLAVASGSATASPPERGLLAIRALTASYQDESAALADGFAATDSCVEAPGLGFMGYHYIHHDRFDDKVQLSKPEALLYADGPDGGRVLTGVEYLVVDADQDLATDDDRPSLFGHPFDGPMPGHEPGMPVHYDLHVWAWEDNPAGTWEPWNPALSC